MENIEWKDVKVFIGGKEVAGMKSVKYKHSGWSGSGSGAVCDLPTKFVTIFKVSPRSRQKVDIVIKDLTTWQRGKLRRIMNKCKRRSL